MIHYCGNPVHDVLTLALVLFAEYGQFVRTALASVVYSRS